MSRSYSFLFRAMLEMELQYPSFADLRALSEISNVAEYFANLKDFTDYSPTYLITGSRVVSLLSFVCAALKAASGQLMEVLAHYGSISDSKVNVAQGTRLGDVARAAGKDLDELMEALTSYRKEGFPAKGLVGVLDLKSTSKDPSDDLKEEHWKMLYKLGYTVKDLKQAGIDLKDFLEWREGKERKLSVKELKGGFKLKELVESRSLQPGDLLTAYKAPELKEHFSVRQLHDAGISAAEIKNVGFTGKEMADGGVAVDSVKGLHDVQTMKAQGCLLKEMSRFFDAKTLYEGGYDLETLAKARDSMDIHLYQGRVFPLVDIAKTGADAQALIEVGCEARHLYQAGFDAKALKEAGFPAPVLRLDITLKELREAGFSLKECIPDTGRFTGVDDEKCKDYIDAGFDAVSIKNAGFKASMMKRAGMSAKSAKEAFTLEVLLKHWTIQEVSEAGVTLADMRQDVRDQKALLDKAKNAGIYKPQDFREAGFTVQRLTIDGEFKYDDLKEAGFSGDEWLFS